MQRDYLTGKAAK